MERSQLCHAAPAEATFAVLASQHLTEAGQVFRMVMYNDNAPGGHYRMANRVQVFDPPRAISGWAGGPRKPDAGPGGRSGPASWVGRRS